MFENIKLGTKIILGFLAVVSLVAVAGIAGYWGVEKVGDALHVIANEEVPIADASMEMMLAVSEGKMLGDELKGATTVIVKSDTSEIERISKAFDQTIERFDMWADGIMQGGEVEGVLVIQTDNYQLASLTAKAQKLHDDEFQPAFRSLKETGQKLIEAKVAGDKAMAEMESQYEGLVKMAERFEIAVCKEIQERMVVADTAEKAKNVVAEEMPLADCAMEGKFAIARSRMAMEEVAQATTEEDIATIVSEYEQTINDFDELITAVLNGGEIDGTMVVATDNEVIRRQAEQLDENHSNFEDAANIVVSRRREMIANAEVTDEVMTQLDLTGDEMGALLEEIEGLAGEEMDNAKRSGDAAKATATWSLIFIVIGSVVAGLLIGISLTHSITKVLNRIVGILSEGAEQVTSASGELSSASQSLAEGATEQAASLEETSSGLEEMSSMIKQNADSAQQVNTLATQAREVADNGAESMGGMNAAIREIQKSADDTARIIKVIDEIAFQTNLLALNAAVEAARAGEAGKGFAVVAEEVRNLAMRSAEAAKNTSELIEESVKNSKNGVDISDEVSKVLKDVVTGIGKTSDLVGEIASASQEHSHGIDQINTAIAQMDKVTQQNAANAEECASASEELNAQAEQMNQVVMELSALVNGRAQSEARHVAMATTGMKRTLSVSDHAFHQLAGGSHGTQHVEHSIMTEPANVVPHGTEEEFGEFNS